MPTLVLSVNPTSLVEGGTITVSASTANLRPEVPGTPEQRVTYPAGTVVRFSDETQASDSDGLEVVVPAVPAIPGQSADPSGFTLSIAPSGTFRRLDDGTYQAILPSAGGYTVSARQVLSDGEVLTAQTPVTVTAKPVDPPVPPAASGVLLGGYWGAPSADPDAAQAKAVGGTPAAASSYYTTQGLSLAYEQKRVKAGTIAVLDLDPKETSGLLTGIANRTAAGIAYVDKFLTGVNQVCSVLPDRATRKRLVKITLCHEARVKAAQSVMTGTDALPETHAKALNVFAERAAVLCPDASVGYWEGGGSGTRTGVATVLAGLTFVPEWVAWDPYVTAAASVITADALFGSFATFIKANATYKSWVAAGKTPALALGEYGIDTGHGDQAAATFISGIRAAATKHGLSWLLWFNRDKTDVGSGKAVRYRIDGGTTPLALAAYKAAVNA